jgi:predicted metalloendopeptidase
MSAISVCRRISGSNFSSGYIYVKNIAERDQVKEDVHLQTDLVVNSFLEMVESLDWLTDNAKKAARAKSNALVRNIGWPSFYNFTDSSALDEYHQAYRPVETMTDFFQVMLALQVTLINLFTFSSLNKSKTITSTTFPSRWPSNRPRVSAY